MNWRTLGSGIDNFVYILKSFNYNYVRLLQGLFGYQYVLLYLPEAEKRVSSYLRSNNLHY